MKYCTNNDSSQVHAAIREKEKDPSASVLMQVEGEQHQLLAEHRNLAQEISQGFQE